MDLMKEVEICLWVMILRKVYVVWHKRIMRLLMIAWRRKCNAKKEWKAEREKLEAQIRSFRDKTEVLQDVTNLAFGSQRNFTCTMQKTWRHHENLPLMLIKLNLWASPRILLFLSIFFPCLSLRIPPFTSFLSLLLIDFYSSHFYFCQHAPVLSINSCWRADWGFCPTFFGMPNPVGAA